MEKNIESGNYVMVGREPDVMSGRREWPMTDPAGLLDKICQAIDRFSSVTSADVPAGDYQQLVIREAHTLCEAAVAMREQVEQDFLGD